MRALPLTQFATEAAEPAELVERLVGAGAIARLPDGRYDSRDEEVASTAQAVIDAGIPFDALAWALTEGRFGLGSLGLIFSEPAARTERTYAELAAGIGNDAAHLPAVYAALGLPEPEPEDDPRIDEAGFVRLWSLVDPTGVVVAMPRGTARFEAIGRVELKGFPAPIALWRANRVPAPA